MTAPDHNQMVQFVQESTRNVLATMFNLEPLPLQSYVDARAEPICRLQNSLIRYRSFGGPARPAAQTLAA